MFLVWMVALLATAPAAHAAGKPPKQIVGGNLVTSTEEAPWSVAISVADQGTCSGAIIGPRRVLTAAHCLFVDGRPVAASQFTVWAGLVDWSEGGDESRMQVRDVASAATHPAYQPGRKGYDVAVLDLMQPWDFSGASVQAIALAPPGSGAGTLRAYGFGRYNATQIDYRLRSLDESLVRQYRCISGVPTILCGQTPTGSTCFGDSGGGLIVPGSPSRLIGVTSFVVADGDGVADCDPGEANGYTDLTIPAISAWLAGNGGPPLAPQAAAKATLLAGDPLTCVSPEWTGSPSLSYDFVSAIDGALLQSGPTTYDPAPQDLGRPITCVVTGRNAGGTAEVLASSSVTMHDPGLGIQLGADGVVALSRSTPDAPLSRLVVYDRDGRAIVSVALDLSKPVTVPKLGSGRYQVCVQSDPTTIYVAGNVCQPWIVNGKAAQLVSMRSVKRWHGLWRVALSASPGLIGKRVTLRWAISKCRTCKARHVTVRRKLSSITRVNSPRVPRARSIRLTVKAAGTSYDGVAYAASHRVLEIHR